MPIYRSTGTLTDFIPMELVQQAQDYLREDDMTQYLDDNLEAVVERIEWTLKSDGHNYYVEAITDRELTEDELKQLAEWTSGQNSDGLGESFEQQDFAWLDENEGEQECADCSGQGYVSDQGDEERECTTCLGDGYYGSDADGHMVSFDWEKNDSKFVRIK